MPDDPTATPGQEPTPPADPEAQDQPGTPPPKDTPPADWRQALPEGLRDSEALKDFKSPAEAAKALVDLKGQPRREAPAKPEEYQTGELPKGLVVAKEDLRAFQGLAKELGLTQQEFAKLVAFDAGRQTKFVEGYQAKLDEAWKDVEGSVLRVDPKAPLKEEEFDTLASMALNKVVPPARQEALGKFMKESGMGAHPYVRELFYHLARKVGGDRLVSGATPGAGKDGKSTAEVLYDGK